MLTGRKAASLLSLSLLALLASVLAGSCASPAYYYQAARGHLALMNSRQDIEAYLAGAEPGDPLAGRLELAREILAFAENELELPANGAYRTFAQTGRDAVVWNVVATPEFSLSPKTWCFVVAGCVPYRGYFREQDALALAERLRRKGFDAAVSRATAYSTLGWFEDPILDTILTLPDIHLGATLIHELAHQAVYVKGEADFNESLASFVEQAGVDRWLSLRGASEAQVAWQLGLDTNARFARVLAETRAELEALYASQLEPPAMREAKRDAFARLERRLRRLASEQPGAQWVEAWLARPPNNADLALVDTYERGLCGFEALFEATGEDFERFFEQVRTLAQAGRKAREAVLQQECGDS